MPRQRVAAQREPGAAVEPAPAEELAAALEPAPIAIVETTTETTTTETTIYIDASSIRA